GRLGFLGLAADDSAKRRVRNREDGRTARYGFVLCVGLLSLGAVRTRCDEHAHYRGDNRADDWFDFHVWFHLVSFFIPCERERAESQIFDLSGCQALIPPSGFRLWFRV